MRYREVGEVHLDFHRSLNGTIAYLRDNYGQELLDETFRRTARDVYRSIHEDLKRGDPEQLVEHWTYYIDREGGQYTLDRSNDEIRLVVRQCPACIYLSRRGFEIDADFCRQTIVINETLAEDTPFEITTKVCGNAQCVQTIRKRIAS
jgi:hypothetical protein